MNRHIFLFIFCTVLTNIGITQDDSADIIRKSQEYHDPLDLISSGKIFLELNETRPSGSDRNTSVLLDSKREKVKITRLVDGIETIMESKKGKSKFKLNGSKKITKEDITKYNLTNDRLNSMKNYYRYLWLLPKTLDDPGTVKVRDYNIVDFFGKTCLEIKINYEPEVGDDTWYFYFNPESFALEGYRFYHDESKNDGEYILLSETTSFKSLRLPKTRKWYMHKDDKYLGSDELVSIKIEEN